MSPGVAVPILGKKDLLKIWCEQTEALAEKCENTIDISKITLQG